MQYNWVPQQRRQPLPHATPPVVISQHRFQRITAHASKAAQLQQQQLQELRQQDDEQLRIGGELLLRQFAGRNVYTTQEQHIAQLRQQEAAQKELERQARDTSVEDRSEDLRVRRERIAKAERLVEQLRPGPRELQCAQLQSEVQRAVKAQRQLQSEYAQARQAQEQLDRRVFAEQVLNGLDELRQQHGERCQQQQAHKRELLQAIEERKQQRQAERAAELQQAQQEREQQQQQQEQQLAKEQRLQARKRAQHRQQAQAALEMAEQREQQLRLMDVVEQARCDLHNAAKCKLEELKQSLIQQRTQQRLQRNEQLALQLAPRLHYSASEDEARHRRQLSAMRRARSAQQQQHRQRRQQVTEERLAIQQQERAAAQAAQQQAAVQRQQHEAQRLENERISLEFQRSQRQQQQRRVQALRQKLDEQLQQRAEQLAKPEVNYNREAQLECLRQDAYFFEYAQQLMTEAKAKGCPIKPFVRAVEQYKSENRLAATVRVPRHLVSKLSMGLRTAGDSVAESKQQQQRAKQQPTEEQLQMAKIEQQLQKIEQLVLEDAKQQESVKAVGNQDAEQTKHMP